jgi:hypothetical protein
MAKNRALQSVRDMVLSLGLVLGVVGLTLLMTLRDEPDDPIREVDITLVQAGALLNAPYDAVVPQGLPETWRPTSARVSGPGDDPFQWHVGFVTPSQEYAAAGQSDQGTRAYLIQEKAGGAEVGTVAVGDERWTRYEREDGKRASLVKVEDGVTTLVTGTGSQDELVTLALSLSDEPVETGPTPAAGTDAG